MRAARVRAPALEGRAVLPLLALRSTVRKDPRMFAYELIGGYRDAVELPWARWQEQAGAGGGDIVSLFATSPAIPAPRLSHSLR